MNFIELHTVKSNELIMVNFSKAEYFMNATDTTQTIIWYGDDESYIIVSESYDEIVEKIQVIQRRG